MDLKVIETNDGTAVCVFCSEPVKWYSGHVIVLATGEQLSAGLCARHGSSREAAPCPNALGRMGCYRAWRPEDGRVQVY